MDTDTKQHPVAVAQRVSNLQSTAEYIICLGDIIREQLGEMREYVKKYGANAAQLDHEWGRMETLVNLMENQARLVSEVSEAFEASRATVVVA